MLRKARALGNQVLLNLAGAAGLKADKLASSTVGERARGWEKWIEDNTLEGTSAAYRFTKLPDGFKPSSKIASGEPCNQRAELEKLVKEWKGIWATEREKQNLVWPDLGEELPRPTAAEAKWAIKTFKINRGTGFDGISPRVFEHLTLPGLECLIDLVCLIEQTAEWEDLLNIIVFLEKATGGWRPIALVYAVLALQGRLRRPLVKDWEAAHDREFFGCVSGKSVETCVWLQAAYAEWARGLGLDSALVLLDLWKAFEQARFQDLINAGIKWNFPMRLLRVALMTYAAPRVLEIEKAHSEQIKTWQGILPGCVYATTLLRLLVLEPLDKVKAAYHGVSLTSVVDDFGLQRCGPAAASLRKHTLS